MLNTIKETLYRAEGKKQHLENELEKYKQSEQLIISRIPAIEEAQTLIQITAQETQNQLRTNIEDIVQLGIDSIFSNEYIFCLEFENRRGKTECDIYLLNQNNTRIDPTESNGGGLVDVISFSLRMACWALSKTSKTIILDEPFKFLSKDLMGLAGELVQTLSEKLGLQIIMVTHEPEMKEIADKVFEIKKNKKGVSEVL